MFQNLIESASHRQDLARRGRFFLGTLMFYAALCACIGVASVYAYNARLDEQNYEVTMLPPWAIPRTVAEAEPDRPRETHPAGTTNEVGQRTRFVTDLNTPTSKPPPISTAPSDVPPVHAGVPYVISDRNVEPIGGGGAGPVILGGGGGTTVVGNVRPIVVATEDVRPPEVVRPTPAPTPARPLMLSQLISSKIVAKPVPPYPQIARVSHIEGVVTVEILVDEQGRVISATPTSGPMMLREAARLAALQARFTPTQLNHQPVKIAGVISYNFTLR
jgi:protein TonB